MYDLYNIIIYIHNNVKTITFSKRKYNQLYSSLFKKLLKIVHQQKL